jgi:transposase
MNEQSCQAKSTREGEPEFAAFVAIDWANQKHYWSLRVAGSEKIGRGELENTPEAVEQWMAELQLEFQGGPLAVALEQSRGALVTMLSKYGQLHLYPVHPLTLAKYREAWYPSGSKNDRKDADLILEILCRHRDHLRRLAPEAEPMRRLQFTVEDRRKLVDQRTALANQVIDRLKMYFPQILTWFSDVTSPLVGDLLGRWGILEELQRAKPETLKKFFREHNCRDEEKIQERIEQIRRAVPATHDTALIVAGRGMVRLWLKQIADLREEIAALEKVSRELAGSQEDWEIYESLPGAGEALTPRLMVAMGTRRERYESASDLQCFSGIAAVKEASGNSQWIHMRFACPKFLRQTFHEWAQCTIQFCDWAKTFYEEQRARKKSHHTAVRALAFKWQRILYRCWKDRKPYQEAIHLANQVKRAVPIQRLAKTVEML